MAELHISGELIASENDRVLAAHKSDYEALGAHLARRNIDIDAITRKWRISSSPCLPGALVRVEHGSRAFPERVSRAASSTSSTIAR